MTQKIQKITASEAARILKISKTRVLQLINLNIIPAERVGRQFVLKDKDVKAARGRKHGRPRKKQVQTAPVVNTISTQETRLQELEELIRNKTQSKQQIAGSGTIQRKPSQTTSGVTYLTVPRPSVTKSNNNNTEEQIVCLGFDD